MIRSYLLAALMSISIPCLVITPSIAAQDAQETHSELTTALIAAIQPIKNKKEVAKVIEYLDTLCAIAGSLKELNAQLDTQFAADTAPEIAIADKMKTLLLDAPVFMPNDDELERTFVKAMQELQHDAQAFEKAAKILMESEFLAHCGALQMCVNAYMEEPYIKKNDILGKVLAARNITTIRQLLVIG